MDIRRNCVGYDAMCLNSLHLKESDCVLTEPCTYTCNSPHLRLVGNELYRAEKRNASSDFVI